jgi:methionyl-tRNA synthetase
VLYTVAETVRRLAILSQPVMPGSMARMLDQLGVDEDARDFTALAIALVPGTALPKPQGVFPRYVEPEEGAT